MSTLNAIVNVTITSSGRGVSRAGFGIPLVLAKHDVFPERFREYNLGTAPADMVTDGFTTFDPAHRAVSALARNTPKPTRVIVGKLLTDFNQDSDITVKPIVAVGGELYSMSVTSPDGTVTAVSYTAIAADTETVIAGALQALLDAIADHSSANVAGVITNTADNASEMFLYDGLDISLMDFQEKTADSNLAAELASLQQLNDTWYGVILADPQSNARITALGNALETQEKVFLATTHDTACGDAVSTTDVMYMLNAAQLFRTGLMYSGDQGAHAAATWMGNGFPFDPGSQTWAYKPLSGVVFDNLTTAFKSAVEGKEGNYYSDDLGTPATNGGEGAGGKMASGEYIDTIRGRDWLSARLRERVAGLLANSRKIPYTNKGIRMVTKEVTAQMREGIGKSYLSPDIPEGQEEPYIVTAPDVSEVSAQDKIDRLLPDVNFEATLAGAIHAVRINGTLQV
ncbi:MAG: DUF3383 family protein [Planctomycetota bacterium]|jgi:hypothetical protein|nr:DUF3383 family protein [Planctomycetota bacterium]